MEKLEKQVNEAEVEREIARWFTKKTALGVLGVIALIYIWFSTHIQHPQLPQGSDPSTFVQPPAVPKVSTSPMPQQTVVDDPRIPAPVRQAGWTEQYPPGAQVQAVEDPKTKILNDHIQREHDSAFASMLPPEEKAAAIEPQPAQPQQPVEQKMVLKSSPTSQEEVYVIPQGTNASLILDSRIESEHAGPMDAHFVRDVYLPGTRTVVIPKGSRVIGDTTTVAAMNQRRLAVSFNKIQRDPADRSCDISLTEPALDEAGASGLTGSVNTHVGSLLAGSALAAVLQGVSMGAFYNGGGGYGPTQVIIGNTMSGMSQTTARLLDRFIKLPSITVHEGGLADFPFTKDTPVKPCGGPA